MHLPLRRAFRVLVYVKDFCPLLDVLKGSTLDRWLIGCIAARMFFMSMLGRV